MLDSAKWTASARARRARSNNNGWGGQKIDVSTSTMGFRKGLSQTSNSDT